MAVPNTVNLSAAAKLQGGDRKRIRKDLLTPLQEASVYGAMLLRYQLTLTDGEVYEWEYINPFSLLHGYTRRRPSLGDVLLALMEERDSLRIVAYMDEATPGNMLRPDAGRSLACFYWTFMELPSWFRSRQHGWFFFGLFPLALAHRVEGGYSYLFSLMLKAFFGKGQLQWSFASTGLACKATSGDFLLKAIFGTLLVDEKAMKEIWSTKGRSSFKPCHLCKNVMGRVDIPDDHPYLVPYTCVQASRFDEHTANSIREMVDHLRRAAGHMSKQSFARLEQMYGLVYNPQGVLWCEELQEICNPALHTYWDWMHILMASGGVAQYEFNQFARRLQSHGVSLERLDDFATKIVWPKGTHWPRAYFQKRVVDDNGGHLKAFASEMFQLMDIFTGFLAVVDLPQGLLEEETECLQSLIRIIDLLSLQEGAVPLAASLDREVEVHHRLFLRLYPECNKPKTHWLRHVPRHLREFRCNLSCFSAERKHKGVKQLANSITKDPEKGALYRAVSQSLSAFEEDDFALTPLFLESRKEVRAPSVRVLFPEMQFLFEARTLRFHGGRAVAGDLLHCRDCPLMEAVRFLQVDSLEQSAFFVEGRLFEGTGPYRKTARTTLVRCWPDMQVVPHVCTLQGVVPCARLARRGSAV